jgi:hypothetical protein
MMIAARSAGRHHAVTERLPSKIRKPPLIATEIAIRIITTAATSNIAAHVGSPPSRKLLWRDRLCIGRYFSLPNALSSMRMRAIISQPNPIAASTPVTGAHTIAATLTISPTTAR